MPHGGHIISMAAKKGGGLVYFSSAGPPLNKEEEVFLRVSCKTGKKGGRFNKGNHMGVFVVDDPKGPAVKRCVASFAQANALESSEALSIGVTFLLKPNKAFVIPTLLDSGISASLSLVGQHSRLPDEAHFASQGSRHFSRPAAFPFTINRVGLQPGPSRSWHKCSLANCLDPWRIASHMPAAHMPMAAREQRPPVVPLPPVPSMQLWVLQVPKVISQQKPSCSPGTTCTGHHPDFSLVPNLRLRRLACLLEAYLQQDLAILSHILAQHASTQQHSPLQKGLGTLQVTTLPGPKSI